MKLIKYMLLLLICFSVNLFACGNNPNAIIQGPFKIDAFNNGRICFQRTEDKRNIDFILNHSIDGALTDFLIERYNYSDGPVELLSVFAFPVKGENNIFVILRWNVNYGDVPLYRYYYEVHAYEKRGGNLIKNKSLEADPIFFGYQTIKKGIIYNYELDSAGKVKKHIEEKYK